MPSTSMTPTSSAAMFIVLRRMRAPLIVLIVIFSVSVLGLVLIAGGSADEPWRMGFFDAFYVISYTATTIGYGEIPAAFNDAQRMWVTLSIYVSVIGWAYAIGTLLSLLQSAAFRNALALQRFRRKVGHLREPFWLIAGHGIAGELIGQRLDGLGRRFVAIDVDQERIDLLELGSYSSEVPGLVADASNPAVLELAGLANPMCAGVLAMTDDEEANLAIVMAASATAPSLPVFARASSPAIKHRMAAFGQPTVIDAFDRFGDHFRVALRAPATEQLAAWLADAPGTPLRPASKLRPGHWIVCGYGRFGIEVVRDLHADGHRVVIIDDRAGDSEPNVLQRDAADPSVLREAGIESAAGLVAGTDNDITNVSIVHAARVANTDAFLVARQNRDSNAPLFDALDPDLLMVPTAVIVQDVMEYLSTPLLRPFLLHAQSQPPDWSRQMLQRLVATCGDGSPDLETVLIDASSAPALCRWLATHPVAIGDLLRDPDDRASRIAAVPLLVARDGETLIAPADDVEVRLGDRLLLACAPGALPALESTMSQDPTTSYVLGDRTVPAGWLLRTLIRR